MRIWIATEIKQTDHITSTIAFLPNSYDKKITCHFSDETDVGQRNHILLSVFVLRKFFIAEKKYLDLSNRHFYRLDDCPINNNNNNDRLTAFDLGQPE